MSSRLRRYSTLGVIVSLVMPILGSAAFPWLLPENRWESVPVHSVVECIGGVMAIVVGAILISRNAQPQATASDIWLASSLFAMGTIDLFHAAVMPGELFVFLRSVAALSGGILIALVSLTPLAGIERVPRSWPWYVLVAALIIGFASCCLPDYIPPMVRDDQFTIIPRSLHFLGGLGFFAAALVFVRRFHRTLELEHWLFAVNAQLFGFASVLFEWSVLWGSGWWWWHAMRLLAYGVLTVFAIKTFLTAERQLRSLNQELLDWNAELGGTVAERTAALKASEERFRLLVEASPAALLVVERSGRIILSNTESRRLFGYEPGELEGQPVEILVPPAVRSVHGGLRDGFFAKRGSRQMGSGRHLVAIRKDGSDFPVEIALTAVETDAGVAALCGIVDLTLREKALEALQNARCAAESANRAKSDFLANMSHEIRTPMHHIIGLTEFVLGTPLTSQQHDYLALVLESAESLMTIINEILDFSKIEAGKLHLEETDFALRDSLGDTVRALANRAHRKGLELNFCIEDDVPDHVIGDQVRLRQILLNLVGNAIVFTERGEVDVVLRQRQRDGDRIELEGLVTDTGIGILPDKLDVIFEAFAQADSSTTRRFGGTGLGLSICRRLVDLMHGRLWVESEVGKGSRFHFTCVMRVGSRNEPSVPPRQLRGLTALVVDDNATNRLILDAMLRKWGMSPILVSSAAEALATLEEAHQQGRQISVVVSDVGMPEVDGYSLCERIRQMPHAAHQEVILLTSYDRLADEARVEQLGVAAHLAKPVKESTLLAAVLKVVARSSAATTAAAVPATTPDASPQLSSMNILLVDDSLTNQKLAVSILKKWGHRVHVANNGREAVAASESNAFDLILMDIHMPEMDGIEATAVIRQNERGTGRHVPIVAMTAHALKGDEQRCLDAGMDDYLAKPIRQAQLLDTLRRVGCKLSLS